MARGKHASRSMNRANEAARDHIDRLTDQLADAKLRARQHESSTQLVPVLRTEIARLKSQIEVHTSDRVRELEDRLDRVTHERDLCLQHATRFTEMWGKLLDLYMAAINTGEGTAVMELLQNDLFDYHGQLIDWDGAGNGSTKRLDHIALARVQRARKIISSSQYEKTLDAWRAANPDVDASALLLKTVEASIAATERVMVETPSTEISETAS